MSSRVMCSQAAFSPSRVESGSISASLNNLCIVQQRLHILNSGRERERRNGGTITVERQHVVTPRRAVTEYEDLPLPLSPQTYEVVAAATQKAGKIKVAGFKGISASAHAVT